MNKTITGICFGLSIGAAIGMFTPSGIRTATSAEDVGEKLRSECDSIYRQFVKVKPEIADPNRGNVEYRRNTFLSTCIMTRGGMRGGISL